MGEDVDFARRMAARGHKVGFAPRARLRHIVKKQQMTLKWALRRCYRHGKYTRIMSGKSYTQASAGSSSTNVRFPKWLIRRLARRSLALPIVALSFDGQRVFQQLKLMAYDLGSIQQAVEIARAGGHKP
jgi:GT2 family glycosyltransferase